MIMYSVEHLDHEGAPRSSYTISCRDLTEAQTLVVADGDEAIMIVPTQGNRDHHVIVAGANA